MNKHPSKLDHVVGTKPAPRDATTAVKSVPREPSAALGQRPSPKAERVSNREAAVMLGIEERTLADWRRRKVGPEYERLANGHVAYYKNQIEDFRRRWEAAPEITGHKGQSKYLQIKKENEILKKEIEKLKPYEKAFGIRANEEIKKIIKENIEYKEKLKDKENLIYAIYENEFNIRKKYQMEVDNGIFCILDLNNPTIEELRKRLIILYSCCFVNKNGVVEKFEKKDINSIIMDIYGGKK